MLAMKNVLAAAARPGRSRGPMPDHTALKERAERLMTLIRAQARRAFVVELAGTPKAGKSTSVTLIKQFFEQCGFRVHLLKERAAECPLPMKGHFFFNSWTTCSMIAEVLETVDTDTDLLILDRGFFDSLMWLELQRRRGHVTDEEADVFSSFVLLPRWSRLVDVTLVMRVPPDVAMARENERRIIARQGSIMSPIALEEVNCALDDARQRYGDRFRLVVPPEQNAGVVEDNAALVAQLLDPFEQWADPLTLAVPRLLLEQRFQQPTDRPQLLQNGAAREALASLLPNIKQDRRSAFEANPDYVQLVACALPRDSAMSFFVLSRTQRDKKSRAFGRYTLWKGCHLEHDGEDPGTADRLLGVASSQLQNRLLTDFHLALELDPEFRALVWRPGEAHAGLFFEVAIHNDVVVHNMQQKEFRQQGRFESQSGVFRSRRDVLTIPELEPWSRTYVEQVPDP